MEENIEPSEADESAFPSGQFDTAGKNVVQDNADDLIRYCLGTPDAQAIQILETEQPIVQWFRADSFIHANVRGKEVIVHIELQTHDSTQVPMPYRMAGYAGLGIRTFRMPIYSHVIYLHPNAGRNDPRAYIQEAPGYGINIEYKVIRLSEIEGQDILNLQLKGLVPFAPLMKPPEEMAPEDWLRRCVEVAEAIPMDAADKPDYLASMAILCNVIFDFQNIREIIPEEILMQSDVAQHFKKLGIEQGIEQGARESIIEGILESMEIRFSASGVEKLKPMLENVETLQRLKELRREALRTYSFETFTQMLENSIEINP